MTRCRLRIYSGMAVESVLLLPVYGQVNDLLSASMSDINATTAADTISNEIPIPVDSAPDSSSIPEQVSETLYIQNLNEMIRIDGSSF
jgi:hypothetical protein